MVRIVIGTSLIDGITIQGEIAINQRLLRYTVGHTTTLAQGHHVENLAPGKQVANIGTIQDYLLVILIVLFKQSTVAGEQGIRAVSLGLIDKHLAVFLHVAPIAVHQIGTGLQGYHSTLGNLAVLALGQVVARGQIADDIVQLLMDERHHLGVRGTTDGVRLIHSDILSKERNIAIEVGETEVDIGAYKAYLGNHTSLLGCIEVSDGIDILEEHMTGFDAAIQIGPLTGKNTSGRRGLAHTHQALVGSRATVDHVIAKRLVAPHLAGIIHLCIGHVYHVLRPVGRVPEVCIGKLIARGILHAVAGSKRKSAHSSKQIDIFLDFHFHKILNH